MAYGVKMKIWGDRACFTRPEMKAERVSYDVMTPSAARAAVEAIYWKPSIRWIIDKIHVLNPIRFDNIRRNELSEKLSVRTVTSAMHDSAKSVEILIEDKRQQRAAMVLRDTAYIIEAHFEAIDKNGTNEGKHLDIFNRRLEKGQCFYQPYLGTREFSAYFEKPDNIPKSQLKGERDLGWMLFDLDFTDKNNPKPLFFRPKMFDGVISVPHPDSEEVIR